MSQSVTQKINQLRSRIDLAAAIRNHVPAEEADEIVEGLEALQDAVDAAAPLVLKDIRYHTGSYAGADYLCQTYNSEWFEKSAFSAEVLYDILSALMDATYGFTNNPYWSKMLRGDKFKPVPSVDSQIAEAVATIQAKD